VPAGRLAAAQAAGRDPPPGPVQKCRRRQSAPVRARGAQPTKVAGAPRKRGSSLGSLPSQQVPDLGVDVVVAKQKQEITPAPIPEMVYGDPLTPQHLSATGKENPTLTYTDA